MLSARTVLIIDDEPDSCLLWKSFLSQLKYQVHTALTLAEGLRLVESLRPAIIFLDNNLPDGLGWDQVDTIHRILPGCRINLVSGYGFDRVRTARQDVSILEKPVSLATIRSLLV